jgi:prepilin-type N-terminal cleavage/methylation domain-containing protein
MIKINKAFTIVELIFSIVIIGILSAVMVPRLMATRDDAKIAVSLSEVGRLVSEISIYYTSNGHFDANLSKMTTVKNAEYTVGWDSSSQKGVVTYYTPKNKTGREACFNIFIENDNGYIRLENIVGTHENVCVGLQKITVYKKLLKTKLLRGNNIFKG